jgi:hypothetical protein
VGELDLCVLGDVFRVFGDVDVLVFPREVLNSGCFSGGGSEIFAKINFLK